MLVDVRFERGAAAAVEDLRDAGAEVVHVSRRYQTVTVAVRPAAVPRLREIPRVGGVTRVLEPLVQGADCGGAKRSEGDAQLLAPIARANLGVDGTGVTVGILSDSFDTNPAAATRAATDVATGDLPGPGSPCGSTTPVAPLLDLSNRSDEGRAMAQIVRDLAPGASISFATAFQGEVAFAASIRALAASGARVIADDVVYYEEPFFQDGPVAVAVDEVTAAGVTYFSAAGNNNVISGGHDVGSWEAPFRDAGSCPVALVETGPGELEDALAGETECVDFDPGPGVEDTFSFRIPANGTLQLDLQWAEPRGGVATDFDAYLLEADGDEAIVASTVDNVGSSQRPFELLGVENRSGKAAEARLAIVRAAGSGAGPLKWIQLGEAAPTAAQYATSEGDTIGPTVFGHAAAAGAIAVAAVPYFSTAAPEPFSSRGPVVKRFGPVAGPGPAAPLALPEALAKPDLAATDGGVNTFFGGFGGGEWRFFGTSAAAPHAAAVAALALQANPGASPAAVRAALAATARPVGAFGPTAVGAGLVDAAAAVDLLALAPQVEIGERPRRVSRVRHPSFSFAANRPASFSCAIDDAAVPCGSPFTWPWRLRDGRHALRVSATDLGGRVGTSAPLTFTVDTKRPQTRVLARPPKLVKTRSRARVVFRFRSSEGGGTFRCKIDRRPHRACGKRLVLSFGPGAHVLRVRARDAAGNLDASPATVRFRVVRVG